MRPIQNDQTFIGIESYRNWYLGYSGISLPYYSNERLTYETATYATSGLVSTPFFGEPFDSQHNIVLWDVESAEVLLSGISSKEVLELHIGTSLLVKHLDIYNGTKLTENLQRKLSQNQKQRN